MTKVAVCEKKLLSVVSSCVSAQSVQQCWMLRAGVKCGQFIELKHLLSFQVTRLEVRWCLWCVQRESTTTRTTVGRGMC